MRFDGDKPVDIYTENFQTARNGDVLTNEDGSARLVWPVSGTPTLREVDPVPTFGSALTDHWSAAQLQAMQEGLSGTGLEVSGLGAYRQSDGSYLLTNADGDVVGTVSEGANRTVVLRTLDGQEVVTDALGQRWSEQELAQAQQATAALSLVSSVMALQQWGEMNDAQRLQSLAGLYNQIDGLSTGQLPGDWGQGVGALGGAMLSASKPKGFCRHARERRRVRRTAKGMTLMRCVAKS
jgi:hypothetical protein